MTDDRRNILQGVGLGVSALILVVVMFLLGWLANTNRAQPPTDFEIVYVPVGDGGASGSLFTVAWSDSSRTWTVSEGTLKPVNLRGGAVNHLAPAGTTSLVVGSYVMDLSVRQSQQRVEWRLSGVMAATGDEIGRAPAFHEVGRLAYDPNRRLSHGGRGIPLWLDSLPARAFKLRALTDCQTSPITACIEILGGPGRVTLETNGQAASFTHLGVGQVVGIPASSVLWFGHIPFIFEQKDSDWIVRLDHDRIPTSRRAFLGPMTAGMVLRGVDPAKPIAFRDVRTLLKGDALPDSRWSPEMEDEYQILIDEELLCLETRTIDGRARPQLVWKAPMQRGCGDALSVVYQTAPQNDYAVDEDVLRILGRRRSADGIVRRTNAILARDTPETSADVLPFVFEWWPVRNGSDLELSPLTLWGIRTQASEVALRPRASSVQGDPPIVLREADGTQMPIAFSTRDGRQYRWADLRGLGPVLGFRDAIDGLDGRFDSIRRTANALPAGATNELELTIDPALQRDLWNRLKEIMQATEIERRRNTWGVTAVALDPLSGDVVSVLNWPEATWWENQADIEAIAGAAFGGGITNSMNRAMMRDQDVGSAFKLLAIYAMADAGVLDAPGNQVGRVSRTPFVVVETDATGRAKRPGRAYYDNQTGPLPIGRAGMRGGLDFATGESSNTFFSFASFMLLGGGVPPVHPAGPCPVDPVTLRRTDAPPQAAQWVICHASQTLNRALGITQSGAVGPPARSTVLLLPRGEDLATRARQAFAARPANGYFRTALQAGFTFFGREEGPNGKPIRPTSVDGSNMEEYQGVPRWQDWFRVLAAAEGRVFRYPAMNSPGAHFGGVEQFNNQSVANVPTGWRAFAQQSVGEDGQGSALSLAVLYSAAARADGAFVAPRLLRTSNTPIGTSPAFGATTARVDAIQAALRQPVRPGGTAASLGSAANAKGLSILGKTGTFSLEQYRLPLSDIDAAFAPLARCGALELTSGGLIRPAMLDWRSWLGSSECEERLPALTAIHRYPPARPTPSVQAEPDRDPEEFTSFVAIVDRLNAPGRPLVFALISDLPNGCAGQRRTCAASLVEQLLPALSGWVQGQQP